MTICPGQRKVPTALPPSPLTHPILLNPLAAPLTSHQLHRPPSLPPIPAHAALPFFVGGYASSGCAGALPLGRHELKTNTSMKSSQFFQNLSTSLLLAMETKGERQQGRRGGWVRVAFMVRSA